MGSLSSVARPAGSLGVYRGAWGWPSSRGAGRVASLWAGLSRFVPGYHQLAEAGCIARQDPRRRPSPRAEMRERFPRAAAGACHACVPRRTSRLVHRHLARRGGPVARRRAEGGGSRKAKGRASGGNSNQDVREAHASSVGAGWCLHLGAWCLTNSTWAGGWRGQAGCRSGINSSARFFALRAL